MKLTILLFTCLVHGIKLNNNILRVIGGRNASEGEFPYVVRILTLVDGHMDLCCSCSIVSQTWSLTAGHCAFYVKYTLANDEQSRIEIEYQRTPKSETSYSKVLYAVVHPAYSWNGESLPNDVGLLKTQPVLIEKFGKLSSLDYTTLFGQEIVAVGYGLINTTSFAPLPHVPHVLEAIVKDCYPARPYPAICYALPCSTQTNEMRTLCFGDSGGPAIHASGIVAVHAHLYDFQQYEVFVKKYVFQTDLGLKRSDKRERYRKGYNAAISVPISSYLDWISSVMKTDGS